MKRKQMNDVFEFLIAIVFTITAALFVAYGFAGIVLKDPFKVIVAFGCAFIFGKAVFDIFIKWKTQNN